MTSYARFWNRIAPRYSRAAIADTDAYEHKLALTRALFSATTRVLEVGCGTGSTALLHAPYVESILATDFSTAMIEVAQQRAAEAGVDNVRFAVESVEDIAGRGERFDVVLALNLLHLVEDLDVALGAIRSVLRPGGALVASTACIGDTLPFMRYLLPLGRALRVLPYVQVFDEQALLAAFARSGFDVEQRYQPEKGRAPAVFHIARPGSA
jgi:ubiquinone/menaquinone biosynthesis C-methylase UbiE